MNCNEYRAQVSAFLDGELSEGEIRDLFQHLSACDGCWRYNLRLQKIRSALKSSSPPSEPAEIDRRKPWVHQRLPVSAPSFVLTVFMAFVFGMVFSLMILAQTTTKRADNSIWQNTQLYQHPLRPLGRPSPNPDPPQDGVH
jgi:anti-sigma factor RsiW